MYQKVLVMSKMSNRVEGEDVCGSLRQEKTCGPFDMRRLSNRRKSFWTWPKSNPLDPNLLAESGFYYMKHSDNTKCAFCEVELFNWMRGDDPFFEHYRSSPNCSFIKLIV